MATQMPPVEALPPEPASERRLAWESLRARDLEEKMDQGAAHADAVRIFVSVLEGLVATQQRRAYLGWDVFVEWDSNDARARVSPDAFLLDGEGPEIRPSLWRTWEPGCEAPRFALEVVSFKSRTKDYETSPLKYAALGVEELAIFDLAPRGDEAFTFQLYRRSPRGQFLRVYAGAGPVESAVLGAWLVATKDGQLVRLARDAEGAELVPTAEERAAAAEARAQAAEARARQLEQELVALRR